MREGQEKLRRVRAYLEENELSGMVLIRQDNFAWITSGGCNRVVMPSERGVAAVAVTPAAVYLVAQVMDGGRIMAEEMSHLSAEYVPLRWYEESVLERALSLAGPKPAADVPCPAEERLSDIYDLHYPLLPGEIETLRVLGRIADEVMTKIAYTVCPGMTDYDVEAALLYEFKKRGATLDVALVGSDERVFDYRHPLPVGARVGRYLLMTPSVRYRGLHANIARSVYFGDALPENIARANEAVCTVAANCFSMLETGVAYADILLAHKALLAQMGFDDAWRGHYPGGRIGYCVCQSDFSLDTARRIGETEAYEWFITVPGAKTAELAVKEKDRVSLYSQTGLWPVKTYMRSNKTFDIPRVLLR